MNDDTPSLGPCCICETTTGVVCVMMLDRRAPIAGHGWGCVVCNLPSDGASAVLCERCAEAYQQGNAELRFVCRGYPASDGRAPYGELSPEVFEHDVTKHDAKG